MKLNQCSVQVHNTMVSYVFNQMKKRIIPFKIVITILLRYDRIMLLLKDIQKYIKVYNQNIIIINTFVFRIK